MFSDASFLAFDNPLGHPAHFTGLELLIFASAATTLWHAISHYRQGERYHLLQWLVAFAYGVCIELIAFNYINSYDHGQFTIQLYHRKLPLYIPFLYPVFHYTGLELVQRRKLGAIAEALVAGLAMCLIDVPFDVAGVNAHWWNWLSGDPNFTVRWLGVPLTSYYWYLAFGAVYALLCRFSRNWIERRSLPVHFAMAPLLALGVVVGGTLAFLPFHGMVALGIPTEAIVLGHASIAFGIAIYPRPKLAPPSLSALALVPIALAAWNLAVLAVLAARGQVAQSGLSLAVAVAASLALAAVIRPPLHKSATAPLRQPSEAR